MSRSGFVDTLRHLLSAGANRPQGDVDVWSQNYIPRVMRKMRIESRRLAEERQESLKALAAYDRRVEHEDG